MTVMYEDAIIIIIIYFENVHFFHAKQGSDIFPYEVPPHIPEYLLPTQVANQALPWHPSHILSKFSYSSPYISPLPPPHFYRSIPNHPHSYAPDAQTTSICHASPDLPHSVYLEDCTNPHLAFYPSATLRTSISPLSASSSSDYADFQPSSPMFQSHLSTHSWHKFCISCESDLGRKQGFQL